jgi:hypothetical protein
MMNKILGFSGILAVEAAVACTWVTAKIARQERTKGVSFIGMDKRCDWNDPPGSR